MIELDAYFWSSGLVPLAAEDWPAAQQELASSRRWIMDGDLGPYDVLSPRLRRADTVVVLDLSLMRCAWRALCRSCERADFWWWLLLWRYRSRPADPRAIAVYSPKATVHLLRSPRQVRRLLANVGEAQSGTSPGKGSAG